jgi:hypothetical protein
MLAAHCSLERLAKMMEISIRWLQTQFNLEYALFDYSSLQIGSTWKAKNDNCTEYECLLENGVVERKVINPCVTTCGIVNFWSEAMSRKKLISCYLQGQEFVNPGSNDCCGKCVDSKCVHEGVLRAIGALWKSSNGCTSFTCKRNALGRVRLAENMVL